MEPEGRVSREWYVQGMSTSLPEDVQWKMYRSIDGLHHCEIIRLGYAIEYDCIDSRELRPTLETLRVQGLFMAGQINGTSGYEEAAGQGILAGINAALSVMGRPPLVLTRDMSYTGVLTDDLTTKGTDEPYRMMTSRAEHRLFLRQDNADIRLTRISYELGLASRERMERTEEKAAKAAEICRNLKKKHFPVSEGRDQWLTRHGQPISENSYSASELVKRPGITLKDIAEIYPDLNAYDRRAVELAEVEEKYEGYLEKEQSAIRKARVMETALLPEDLPYESIEALRLEARQKLEAQKPRSLAAASRIPGVSPADIAVLMVYLKKNGFYQQTGEKEEEHV